jgi:hypothetical protein
LFLVNDRLRHVLLERLARPFRGYGLKLLVSQEADGGVFLRQQRLLYELTPANLDLNTNNFLLII